MDLICSRWDTDVKPMGFIKEINQRKTLTSGPNKEKYGPFKIILNVVRAMDCPERPAFHRFAYCW
jgi:hypothetical protein